MIIGKRRDVHEKIKGLAIGTVALLAMTVPMLCPDATQAGPRGIPRGGPPAAQNGSEPIPSDPSQPVDASSRTLGCGTATNIGLDNMAPLYVDGNPCNSSFVVSNLAYTNIKICPPGSQTNCQVIDHVIVDTGSVGLRIGSSVINSKLLAAMPYVQTNPPPPAGPQILTNCVGFADGSTLYGPVQTADVYIADRLATNFPLQIFGKNLTPPNGCGSAEGIKELGANGLVGVRITLETEGGFYSCNTDGSSCTSENTTSNPTPNLISKLQNDNNGITIDLHNIKDSGATVPVLGLLILGVGTQADNTPPEGIIPLQANSSGSINLTIGNNTTQALIDSGTDVLFINDPNLPLCSDGFFYCPITTVSLNRSSNPTPTTPISLGLYSYNANTPAFDVTYKVANADTLFANGIAVAYNDLAIQNPGFSILGLSMFFGRTMYFVFAGQPSPLGTGPINAMWPQQ
jgi:hypothetical protein